MARLSRLVVPHLPHYIYQRGNDRQKIFRDEADFQYFQNWLRDAARQFSVAIHAYALMDDELHLLTTPTDDTGLARMMQWVGRYYVPYFNYKYGRTGTLWEGRFRTTIAEPEAYLLACCRYIEMSPVLAGRAVSAADHAWSSFAHHVGDKHDSLISDHPLYWALGNTPFEREAAYRQLFSQPLASENIDSIATTVRRGGVLGTEQFKISLEKRTSRRVRPGKRGRPFKFPRAE